MPRRTLPVPGIARVKNRYSEKALHVPSDFAIFISAVLALASAGLVALVILALAAIVGLIIFRAE